MKATPVDLLCISAKYLEQILYSLSVLDICRRSLQLGIVETLRGSNILAETIRLDINNMGEYNDYTLNTVTPPSF